MCYINVGRGLVRLDGEGQIQEDEGRRQVNKNKICIKDTIMKLNLCVVTKKIKNINNKK